MRGHIPRECHEYIEQIWLIPYKDKFCAAWLVGVEHFGQIFSFKLKSAHAAFRNFTNGFFSVYFCMKLVCKSSKIVSNLLDRGTKHFLILFKNICLWMFTRRYLPTRSASCRSSSASPRHYSYYLLSVMFKGSPTFVWATLVYLVSMISSTLKLPMDRMLG